MRVHKLVFYTFPFRWKVFTFSCWLRCFAALYTDVRVKNFSYCAFHCSFLHFIKVFFYSMLSNIWKMKPFLFMLLILFVFCFQGFPKCSLKLPAWDNLTNALPRLHIPAMPAVRSRRGWCGCLQVSHPAPSGSAKS